MVWLLTSLVACVSDSDNGTLPFRPEDGVFRADDGEFYLVSDPCQQIHVTEVRLMIVQSGTAEPDKRLVLQVEFLEPVPISDLIVSLDPQAVDSNEKRTVVDADALERFRHDDDYLTSIQDPFFFAAEYFDLFGSEFRTGSQLAARFGIPSGMVGLASGDYPLSAVCENGLPGWTFELPKTEK